jgi:hypothetical protein
MSYEQAFRSFAIDPTERFLFAGDISGRLYVIDIDSFEPIVAVQAHAGVIERVAVHPSLPYLGTLAADHTLVLWRYEGSTVTKIHEIDLRKIAVQNPVSYGFPSVPTVEGIALSFHPEKRRALTRNALGAPLELSFDDEQWETLWCHGYAVRDEPADTTEIRYVDGDRRVLFATNRGTIKVIDPARLEAPVFEWSFDRETIHELLHVGGTHYLVPSDGRRIHRIDISGAAPDVNGPIIARDEIESIADAHRSGRAYVASFDRHVYEIDTETCTVKRVVLRTPFKLRWMRCLQRMPSILIVQCRNGALYKVDLEKKSLVGALRETPAALWSGVTLPNGDVVIAGEGSELLKLQPSRPGDRDRSSGTVPYVARWISTSGDPGFYTKRVCYHRPTASVLLGRTDGRVHALGPRGERVVVDLGSPIRDLATSDVGHVAFAVTEDGRAHRIDLEAGVVTAQFQTAEQPLWSLAYNGARELLVVSERYGTHTFLDARTMKVVETVQNAARAKRMRWLDDDTLAFVIVGNVYKLDLASGECGTLFEGRLNTVEDFALDPRRRYFAHVGYYRELALYEYGTFAHLSTTNIDMDYPKGLLWLEHPEGALDSSSSSSGYPFELVVFGRSGVARRYKVHNNCLVAVGAMNEPSYPPPRAGVEVLA